MGDNNKEPERKFYNGALGDDLLAQATELIESEYSLEAYLYDMWGDFESAKVVIEHLLLSAEMETNIGKIGVKVLDIVAHPGTEYTKGTVAVKCCVDFDDGKEADRVTPPVFVITANNVNHALHNITTELSLEALDVYDQRYTEKYGEKKEDE